jgi:hypothetical protein
MGIALGNASGAGAMGLPTPGGVPQAGGGQAPQFNNALAQMLAGLGPQYQPGDTRWGLPGDRLLRFTPQTGNQGMTFGGGTGTGLGKGGTPPVAGGAGGGSSGTLPNGTTVSTPGLPGGSNVTIDWNKLQSAMNTAPGGPGAPAINAAMEKLKPGYMGNAASQLPPSMSDLQATLASFNKGRPLTDAEYADFNKQLTALRKQYQANGGANGPLALQAINEASNRVMKDAGYGPGAATYV